MPYNIRIEGTLREDEQISAVIIDAADDSPYSPSAATYTWFRDGIAIEGATGQSYLLVSEDAGANITVTANFHDEQVVSHHVSSEPSMQQAFRVDATAVTGDNNYAIIYLAADVADGQAVLLFHYQASGWARYDTISTQEWEAAGLDYVGVAEEILSLVPSDLNPTNVSPSQLYAAFTALFPRGSMIELFERVANVNDPAEGAPDISGIAREGEILYADFNGISDPDGVENAANFRYQWLRDGQVINGATSATYAPIEADIGAHISLQLSFTDDFGGWETRQSPETATIDVGVSISRSTSFILPENGYTLDLTLLGSEALNGTGNSLHNRITGNAGANVLSGMGGRDRIYGRGGDDRVAGGAGHDSILGERGNDTLFGQSGNDTLYGQEGTDLILGGSGNDFIVGHSGSDTMNGGAGDDYFIGGSVGRDVFVFNGRFGRDIIYDFQGGADIIDLSGLGLRFSDLDIGYERNDTVITLKSGRILLEDFDYHNLKPWMFDFV